MYSFIIPLLTKPCLGLSFITGILLYKSIYLTYDIKPSITVGTVFLNTISFNFLTFSSTVFFFQNVMSVGIFKIYISHYS